MFKKIIIFIIFVTVTSFNLNAKEYIRLGAGFAPKSDSGEKILYKDQLRGREIYFNIKPYDNSMLAPALNIKYGTQVNSFNNLYWEFSYIASTFYKHRKKPVAIFAATESSLREDIHNLVLSLAYNYILNKDVSFTVSQGFGYLYYNKIAIVNEFPGWMIEYPDGYYKNKDNLLFAFSYNVGLSAEYAIYKNHYMHINYDFIYSPFPKKELKQSILTFGYTYRIT